MNDLTITIHCLERMEERWPKLVMQLSDQEIGSLIQGEFNDAMAKNRFANVCPLELANNNVNRWKAEKNVFYVWNLDKARGYVVSEKDDGFTVLTVLVGQDPEKARRKLQKHSNK